MDKLRLVPFYKITILTLIGALLIVISLSQAGSLNYETRSQLTNTTTSSGDQYETSNNQIISTNTTTQNQSTNDTFNSDYGVPESEPAAALDPEIATDKAVGATVITKQKLSISKSIVSYVVISLILFTVISTPYIALYNNEDLRLYVNQAFNLAGFSPTMTMFGRKWVFTNGGTIELKGIQNINFEITLPVYGDPREFGLWIDGNYAKTTCSLEMLPVKLQLLNLYLKQ